MRVRQIILEVRSSTSFFSSVRYRLLCITSTTVALYSLACVLFGCGSDKEKSEQQPPESDNWFFWCVDWKPDSDYVVAGGSNDTFLKLISSGRYSVITTYPTLGTVTKTKWHPTENKLAVAVQDGKSYPFIFDMATEQHLQLDSTSITGARAIGWNAAGDLLAIGDYEGNLIFYNESGDFQRSVYTHQKAIIGLDWHPNKNLLIAVGDCITTYNYDLDTLNNISDRDEEVLMLCVDWHPSGNFFVTGDYGDFEYHYSPLLQYWTPTGKRLRAVAESQAEIRNLQWSGDGNLLATASDKIRLWNMDGELVAESAAENLLWGIAWNETDDMIVTSDESRNIVLWSRALGVVGEIKF